MQQQRPRYYCVGAHSDQSLHHLLTEPLDTTECFIGEQMPNEIHTSRVERKTMVTQTYF